MTAEMDAKGVRRRATGTAYVSVVVPVHNAERYVYAAVESAFASDLREIEVIAVEDGSSDRSLHELDRVADSRFTLITQSPSGGPSRPRNVGISAARGRYVAFLDADDLMRPDKLSRTVRALDENSSAVIAFTDYERIDGAGHVIGTSTLGDYSFFSSLDRRPLAAGWQLLPKEEFARGLLRENFIGTSGAVVRASALSTVGAFDESLTYSEDRDLWFRLAHAGDALYSPRIGHSYRVFPGSLSYRPGGMQARNRIVVLERERARWNPGPETRQVDRLIADNLGALGYEERRSGSPLAAARMFIRAWGRSPETRYLRGAVGSILGRRPSRSPGTT